MQMMDIMAIIIAVITDIAMMITISATAGNNN